jgi:hypothetical protein
MPGMSGEEAATNRAESEEPAADSPASAPPAPTEPYWAWAVLGLAAAVYAILSAGQISRAYVDFGDGNYLYIASRIADGLVPYRDIMAPQPPAHLLVGAALLTLGGKMGIELLLVRWFSILLRVATAVLTASVARRASGSRWAGTLAGATYLFLPNGFIWTLGYQSEPLEILFILAAVRFILALRPAALAAASVFAALGVFTNMTAAPYAVLMIMWLVWRLGWRSLYFIAPLGALIGLGVAGMELWTGAYLQNVFFNQVGTYPQEGLAAYVGRKLWREGSDIAAMEGFAVVLALLGVGLCLWRERKNALEFLALFGLASLGSIVFVSKGGTVDYIFTLGEPYVAIFLACLAVWTVRIAAGEKPAIGDMDNRWLLPLAGAVWASAVGVGLWRWSGGGMGALFLLADIVSAGILAWFLGAWAWRSAFPGADGSSRRGPPAEVLAGLAAASTIALVACCSLLVLRTQVVGGQTYQLPPERVEQIARVVRDYSAPRQAILSPPYFAYDTRRLVAGEYCEIFIWNIGYFVEQDWGRRGRPALPTDGPFTRKALELARALERQEIPLVILDEEQTGRIPEIRSALQARYRPLVAEIYPTRDTPLGFYVPRKEGESPAPLAQTLDDLYPPPSLEPAPASPWREGRGREKRGREKRGQARFQTAESEPVPVFRSEPSS